MTGFIDDSNLSRQARQTTTRLVTRHAGEEGDLNYALSAWALSVPERGDDISYCLYGEKAITQRGTWYLIAPEKFLESEIEANFEDRDPTKRISSSDDLPRFGLFQLEDWSYGFPSHKEIHDFGNEPYTIGKPIPVMFHKADPSGYLAVWEEANVSMVGETWLGAFMSLKAEILNTLEDYEANEGQLGPEPKRQLRVLRSFVIRKF
jgi:hypothetical protein